LIAIAVCFFSPAIRIVIMLLPAILPYQLSMNSQIVSFKYYKLFGISNVFSPVMISLRSELPREMEGLKSDCGLMAPILHRAKSKHHSMVPLFEYLGHAACYTFFFELQPLGHFQYALGRLPRR
jgi:hypothetical protein